jgi:hypothetical protein
MPNSRFQTDFNPSFATIFLLQALLPALEYGAAKFQILIDNMLSLGQSERSSNHPRRNIHPGRIPTPLPSRGNEQARLEIFPDHVSVLAWPSQGGFVMIEDATGLDFQFLNINPLEPPTQRDRDQNAEDAFAKRLLLIGGKWWENEDRYQLFKQVYPKGCGGTAQMETPDRVKPLTERERRFTAIGWPSTGGLWVSEFEVDWDVYMEYVDEDLEPPASCFEPDMMLIRMARTMDEKCALLSQKFHGKFFSNVSEYEGLEWLNSFNENV